MTKFRVQPPGRRAHRRRSRRACSGCHYRKVRCDVTTRGSPCTSCRFYDISCFIPIDRREKLAKLIAKDVLAEAPSIEGLGARHDLDTNIQTGSADKTPEYWMRPTNEPLEILDDEPPSTIQPANKCKWLPDYASPLSSTITWDDCNFLRIEGAFDVPDKKIRNELLRNYLQFVHPALPVLNLEEFLMVIDKSYNCSQGVSFLLFQAVIFAATAFQTAESLATEGFRDRREARKARFERLKLLYTLNCEDDRLTVLQTVLLMTLWDDNTDDDAWHFVGVAKAILHSIDTNPTDSEAEFIKHHQGCWNRIIWSVYMRDRLVSLRMRRSFQIKEADFERPMLRLSDFDVGPLSTKCCLGSDGSHPSIRDPSTRRLLSQVTITLAEYCRCITRILGCQYTVAGREHELRDTSPEPLIPRRPAATSAEILLRDSELTEWHDSLPGPLQLPSPGPFPEIKKHGDVILYFRTLLNGIHNLASSILHRSQLFTIDSTLPELVELSKSRVHDAASGITKLCAYRREGGLNYMPSDIHVTIIEAAIITHFAELQSATSSVRQLAMKNFQSCSQALRQLRDTYPSADATLDFLDIAVRKRASSLPTDDIVATQSRKNDFGDNINETTTHRHIDTPEQHSSPSISQQLEKLNPPQMSKLLCSHFMMTPGEKNLLQSLVDLDSDSEEFSSEEDSFETSAPESMSYQMTDSAHQVDTMHVSIDEGEPSSPNNLSELFPALACPPYDDSRLYYPDSERKDDWELLQMLSEYCTE